MVAARDMFLHLAYEEDSLLGPLGDGGDLPDVAYGYPQNVTIRKCIQGINTSPA